MDKKKTILLNLRYMLANGFYWALWCPVTSFMTAYLLGKGMGNTSIGILTGVAQGIVMIQQPIVGARVDRHPNMTNARMCLIFTAGVLASALILLFQEEISPVMIVFSVILIVMAASVQPFVNGLAFDYEHQGIKVNFGLGRGIGSVAFAVTALILGRVTRSQGTSFLPIVVLALAILFVLGILFYASGRIRQIRSGKGLPPKETGESLIDFLKSEKKFMMVMLGGVCLFFGHMLINTYFLQIEQNVGGDSGNMGTAVFLAAMVEVPMMFGFVKLKDKIDCGILLVISGIVFSVKILLTALAGSVGMILAAQCLECASFALYVPASVYYAKTLIHDRNLAKGQTMAVWSITTGSIAAALLGGVLLDSVGVRNMLLIGFAVSAAGTVLMAVSRQKVLFRNGEENVSAETQ